MATAGENLLEVTQDHVLDNICQSQDVTFRRDLTFSQ